MKDSDEERRWKQIHILATRLPWLVVLAVLATVIFYIVLALLGF